MVAQLLVFLSFFFLVGSLFLGCSKCLGGEGERPLNATAPGAQRTVMSSSEILCSLYTSKHKETMYFCPNIAAAQLIDFIDSWQRWFRGLWVQHLPPVFEFLVMQQPH